MVFITSACGIGASKVDDQSDFSADTLINDTIEVIEYLSHKFENTSIILVGHSMGGSIATKTVQKIFEQKEVYKFYAAIKGSRGHVII